MRRKSLITSLFIGCLLLALMTFGFFVESGGPEEVQLRLTLKPDKAIYLPGEVITFTLTLTNWGAEPVRFLEHLTPEKGYTHIRIGRTQTQLDRYVNPKWGRRDLGSHVVTLGPNESISRTTDILWNLKPTPDVSSMSPEVVRAATEDRILHNFAFPEPGRYFVQAATSVVIAPTHGEPSLRILSDIVEIPIEKPQGEDLEFWNSIKDDGGIAYFLQEGDFTVPNLSNDQKERLEQRIEELLILHPSTTYSQRLRSRLDSFRDKQTKVKN